MKRLNGMDAMLLYSETPNLHTHTMKIAVINANDCDGEFDFASFREAIARRLPMLEPLCYRLVDVPWKLHHPMWAEHCDVDLDYHLRRVQIARPGGRRELDELIGQIASTALDRNHPLWEFYFVEGMPDNRFALIGKVHHALADGVASSNLLARLMDLQAPSSGGDAAGPTAPASPAPVPSTPRLLWAAQLDHFTQLASLPRLVSDAAVGLVRVRRESRGRAEHPEMARMFHAPITFLNHVVSPSRTFATAALPLTAVKQTARELGVTFNDIVLAAAAGGLRKLLMRYDGNADRPILATVPVSTDRSPDRISGNEISGLTISLPVHIDDALRRVQLIAEATSTAKQDHDLLGPALQGRMMNYLPPSLASLMFRRGAKRVPRRIVMNVAVSNVPGPRERGHIAGAPVSELYSVGILSAGSAFNLTVWSYVDQLDIAVLSDDQSFEDVHEATDAIVLAFADIRRAAGLPPVKDIEAALPPAAALPPGP